MQYQINPCVYHKELNRKDLRIDGRKPFFFVACAICGACGPWGDTKAKAVRLWNREEMVKIDGSIRQK